MASSAEWFEAGVTSAEVFERGEEVCGEVVNAPLALAFSADGVVVIEGTAREMRAVLRAAWNAVTAHEVAG